MKWGEHDVSFASMLDFVFMLEISNVEYMYIFKYTVCVM